MNAAAWETLTALVPAPSHSHAGRRLEAAFGTVAHVKGLLTTEGTLRGPSNSCIGDVSAHGDDSDPDQQGDCSAESRLLCAPS
jgi:hypothetical protein